MNGKQNAFVRKFGQVYIEQGAVDRRYEEVFESVTSIYSKTLAVWVLKALHN